MARRAHGAGEIQLGERAGAVWLALDYRVPLASNADAPDSGAAMLLDPQIGLTRAPAPFAIAAHSSRERRNRYCTPSKVWC